MKTESQIPFDSDIGSAHGYTEMAREYLESVEGLLKPNKATTGMAKQAYEWLEESIDRSLTAMSHLVDYLAKED